MPTLVDLTERLLHCPRCGLENPEYYEGKYDHCKACHRKMVRAWKQANPLQTYRQRVESRRRRRARALAKLGGTCCRCAFSDPRALQIDHVNGGGRSEQAEIGNDGIIKRVLAGEDGYQLLCANCNSIKRHEEQELPAAQLAAWERWEAAVMATIG
jgi:hypothetical protein